MSFNDPLFSFFENINNEVESFNNFLDPWGKYYGPRRQALKAGTENSDETSSRQLTKVKPGNVNSSLMSSRSFRNLDNWFNNDFSLVPRALAPMHSPVPVDIIDEDNDYILRITAPGVKSKKDIDLEYHQNKNQIIVAGEIPNVITEADIGKVKVKERATGKFRRVVSLPEYPEIDADNIKADYSSGILTLQIPKLKPRKGDKGHIHKISIVSQDELID